MKCINNKILQPLLFFLIITILSTGCSQKTTSPVTDYEKKNYTVAYESVELFATDLCVCNEEILLESFDSTQKFHAVALFDLTEQRMIHANNIHERLHPASTTKIMTLYLALKHGNLADTVTISKNAVSVPSDSSVAGFSEGDQLPLKDVLYSLMLPSGNDSAVAIAEHISGDVESFVALMNKEAYTLGATNTNFVNPHGYPDSAHYTTAYDLYLIFNECISNEQFKEIVGTASYTAAVTTKDGSQKTMTWNQSNQLVNGTLEAPKGVTVIGGKTGTTTESGACLVLYSENSASEGYISIIMGAVTRPVLYDHMVRLISAIEL